MAATEQPSKSEYEDLVKEAKRQTLQARNQLRSEMIGSSHVSFESRKALAKAALAYRDTLWDYKDKRQNVAQGWDESDIDRLEELLHETSRVPVAAPGDTAANNYEERPALMTVDPWWLIGVTKQLDDIAANLGFLAHVDQQRPLGKVGGDGDGE